MITGIQTACADGLDIQPYAVWDEFLQREQVRFITAAEYFGLAESDFVRLIRKPLIAADQKTSPIFNMVITGHHVLLSYGSKKWRGEK